MKSPRAPDEKADIGEHTFTYALFPHEGPFTAETVVREAYALNAPLYAVPHKEGNGTLRALDFCKVSNPNVIVEAVKKAEADDAAIVRLYEAGNTRGDVTVSFGRSVKKVYACNLMEENTESIKARNDDVTVAMMPFEIKTLMVYFK